MAGSGGLRRVSALARLDTLDGLRSRRQLLLRTLLPVLLFSIVLGLSLLTRSNATVNRVDPYTVAVQGDLSGARETLASFDPARLRFVASTDAPLDAARSADIGMEVPAGLDETLRQGTPAHVVLFETALASESRSAAAYIRSGFADLHQRAVTAALPDSPGPLFTVDVQDVQRSQQGQQLQIGGFVAAAVLLQTAMLVASTATRLLSRRNRGLLAAQLLLPFERWQLALSKGLAELELGLLTSIPLALLATGVAFVNGLQNGGITRALTDVVLVLAALVAFSITMTALGVLAGTVCRTQEQVSLASAVIVILTALVASQVGLSTFPIHPLTSLIPVLGLEATLSRALAGRGTALAVWVSVVTTVAFGALILRLAARWFRAERLVLREST